MMRMQMPHMLKSFFLSEKKLLNAILRAKLKYMKNVSFSWNKCFLQCRRQIFMSLSFFAEKVILELNAQNHFFRASKNTNSVFSATKQMRRMQMPHMLKSFFLSEKKLLNEILRAKLNYMKSVSFSWNKCFLQCRRQIFMSLSFFAEQVILELNCTKSLL